MTDPQLFTIYMTHIHFHFISGWIDCTVILQNYDTTPVVILRSIRGIQTNPWLDICNYSVCTALLTNFRLLGAMWLKCPCWHYIKKYFLTNKTKIPFQIYLKPLGSPSFAE